MNNAPAFEPNDKLHEEMHLQIKKIHSTNCDYVNADVLHQYIDEIYMAAKSDHIPDAGKKVDATPAAAVPEQTKLAVWYGSMPESNGRKNWTAVLHKDGDDGFDIFTDGHTIDRSEYPDRVKYAADCVRWLIGELPEKPFILDYDADKCSDYEPVPSPRITEQDAREILNGSLVYDIRLGRKATFSEFLASAEGRALLDRLNAGRPDHIAEAGKMIGWQLITEDLLKTQPEWLYGDLWVLCDGDAEVGYYEWEQGYEPDRIKGDNVGDRHAIGLWVMPLIKPEPPQFGGVGNHSVDANKKVSPAAIAQDEYPKVSFVLSHKYTCANVQPKSTLDTPCDCGAIIDGKAVKVEPQSGGAQ